MKEKEKIRLEEEEKIRLEKTKKDEGKKMLDEILREQQRQMKEMQAQMEALQKGEIEEDSWKKDIEEDRR